MPEQIGNGPAHSLSVGDVLIEAGVSEEPRGTVEEIGDDGSVLVDWEDAGEVRHSEGKIASALGTGGIVREDGMGKELSTWP